MKSGASFVRAAISIQRSPPENTPGANIERDGEQTVRDASRGIGDRTGNGHAPCRGVLNRKLHVENPGDWSGTIVEPALAGEGGALGKQG
jgi:hypothetical protein